MKSNNKFILVDGTSSCGKTTICKYFSSKEYLHFQIDSYFNDKRIDYNKLFTKIKNSYGMADKIYLYEPTKLMVYDAINTKKQNILFDHVFQKEIIDIMKKKKLSKNLFIINVFANINDLARNIESRRKEGDNRGVFVFSQFSDRYIKCKNNDVKKIETVNRKNFKDLLLKKFKYEFKNEDDLIKFANNVFEGMNILDDKDHFIKLRDEYICDYLLITTNKTKDDIFNELKNLIL